MAKGQAVDAVDVYSLLVSMRALHLRPQKTWLDMAAHGLALHLPQLDPPQLVELLACFAELALQPHSSLLQRVEVLLLPDLPQLQPRVLTRLLVALADLGHVPPTHFLDGIWQGLSTPRSRPGKGPVHQLQANELCGLARAAAQLSLQPPLELLQGIVDRTEWLVRASAADGAVAAVQQRMMPRRASSSTVTFGPAGALLTPRRRGPAASALQHSVGAPAVAAPLRRAIDALQLATLMLNLRTLAAPLPGDWQQLLCDYVACRLLDGTAPAPLSRLLGAMAKCNFPLGPQLAPCVAKHLQQGLRATLIAAAAAADPVAAGLALQAARQHQHRALGADSSAAGPAQPCCPWTPAAVCGTLAALLQAGPSGLPQPLVQVLYPAMLAFAPRLDAQELTASLHALPELAAVAPPPPQLLMAYQRLLARHVRQLAPHQQSMALHAFVRLGMRPHPACMGPLMAQAFHTMPRFNEAQLAGVACSVARLGVLPTAEWMERLMVCAAGHMSCFSGWQLAQLGWAAATVGYRPPPAWARHFLTKAQCQFRTSDARTLSNLVWAVASLELQPDRAWLDELCDALGRRLQYAAPQAVANAVWALARLGHRPDATWLQHVLMHMRPRLASLAAGAQTSDHSSSSSGGSSSYHLGDIAQVCYSLAKLGIAVPPDWLDVAMAAAAQSAVQLTDEGDSGSEGGGVAATAQHMTRLVHALARMRHTPRSDAMASLLRALTPLALHAAPSTLALLMTSLAALQQAQPHQAPGARLPRDASDALLLACHRKLLRFSPRQHAMVMWAIVSLRLHIGKRWLSSLELALTRLVAMTHSRAATESGRARRNATALRGLALTARAALHGGRRPLFVDERPAPLPARVRCQMLWSFATVVRRVRQRIESGEQLTPPPPSGAQQQGGADADVAEPANSPAALRRPAPPHLHRLWTKHAGLVRLLLPTRTQLNHCNSLDLAQLVWALGSLKLQPPRRYRARLFSAVTKHLLQVGAPYQPPCADGAHEPGAAASAICPQVSLPQDPATAPAIAAAPAYTGRLPAKAAAAAAEGPSGQGVAMLAWGLSSIGCCPPPSLQAAVVSAALQHARAGRMSPQGLVMVLAALVRWRRMSKRQVLQHTHLHAQAPTLKLKQRPKPRAAMRSSCSRSPRQRAAAKRSGAAELRGTLNELRVQFAQVVLQDSSQRLAAYGPQGVCWLLWALAGLGVTHLPEPWFAAFKPLSLKVLAQLPSGYGIMMLDSLGRVGVRINSGWVAAAEQVVETGGGVLLPSQGRALALALARLRGQVL